MLARLSVLFLLLVGVGGFGLFAWIAAHPAASPVAVAAAPVAKPITRAALVSSGLLHAGQLLRPDDLAVRDFPADSLPPGALLDSAETRHSITGALLRTAVPAGGLLLSPGLVLPGDHGYLAAVLTPGKRAVSVGVDAVTGVSGLVWPGDSVDLILSLSLDDPGVPLGHRMAAETVLTGLRVLAADQDLVRGEKPANPGSGGDSARTITLEASPADAQRILVASRLGRLSLSVCPLGRCDPAPPASAITWSSDLSVAMARSSASRKEVIHLFSGSSDQKDFQFP